MPNDVKIAVSIATLIVALAFAYWEDANGRADLFWLVIGFSIFAVIAMWVFPEAQGGKPQSGDPKKSA